MRRLAPSWANLGLVAVGVGRYGPIVVAVVLVLLKGDVGAGDRDQSAEGVELSRLDDAALIGFDHLALGVQVVGHNLLQQGIDDFGEPVQAVVLELSLKTALVGLAALVDAVIDEALVRTIGIGNLDDAFLTVHLEDRREVAGVGLGAGHGDVVVGDGRNGRHPGCARHHLGPAQTPQIVVTKLGGHVPAIGLLGLVPLPVVVHPGDETQRMLDAAEPIQTVVHEPRGPVLGVSRLPEIAVPIVEVGRDQVFGSGLLGDLVHSVESVHLARGLEVTRIGLDDRVGGTPVFERRPDGPGGGK